MSAPHTPGPWTFTEHGGTWYVFGPYSAMVADSGEPMPLARVRGVGRGATYEEQRGNAELIAAAPSMLAALMACVEMFGPEYESVLEDCGEVVALTMARRAIAEAALPIEESQA